MLCNYMVLFKSFSYSDDDYQGRRFALGDIEHWYALRYDIDYVGAVPVCAFLCFTIVF